MIAFKRFFNAFGKYLRALLAISLVEGLGLIQQPNDPSPDGSRRAAVEDLRADSRHTPEGDEEAWMRTAVWGLERLRKKRERGDGGPEEYMHVRQAG